MALDERDPKPAGISIEDAYEAVWTWYLAEIERRAGKGMGHPTELEAEYFRHLPDPPDASRAQRIDSLRNILGGYMEWGFNESDGKYKMATYAATALDGEGISHAFRR